MPDSGTMVMSPKIKKKKPKLGTRVESIQWGHNFMEDDQNWSP